MSLRLHCEEEGLVVDVIPQVLRLVLMQVSVEQIGSSLCYGPFPGGIMVCTQIFHTAKVCIEPSGEARLMLGDSLYKLPWHELNKVADALRLEIPLPHPPGGTLVESDAAGSAG